MDSIKEKMRENNQQGFPGFPKKKERGNYWSYPAILDGWWQSLSGSEQKVLDYMLRHTWGFSKPADEISLSQFQRGIQKFDTGTGISKTTIIKSIKGLIKKGFVEKSEGKHANYYKLVQNSYSPSKDSVQFDSKESIHTIDSNTINNKQYDLSSKKGKIDAYKNGVPMEEKPYFWDQEMRWLTEQHRWMVIPPLGDGPWKEFVGRETDIEWMK